MCVTNTNVSASKIHQAVAKIPVDVADDPTVIDNSPPMQTRRPQQPCYAWHNVWHKQMSNHIERLQVLGRAPSDGCTVAHVITQHELDEIVKHGARAIHLTNPMQNQVTGNISWAVATEGVLDNNGEILLTTNTIF